MLNKLIEQLNKKALKIALHHKKHRNLTIYQLACLGYTTSEEYAYKRRLKDRYYKRLHTQANNIINKIRQCQKK